MAGADDDEDYGESAEYDALVSATADARVRYFRTLGEVEDDVWIPVVNPVLRGGAGCPPARRGSASGTGAPR